MKPARKIEAGAVVAGLVALHEHRVDLRQQRRLVGKPSFSDQVPWGLYAVVLVGFSIFGVVLLVVAIWPYLLVLAVLLTAALVWRRHRRARHR